MVDHIDVYLGNRIVNHMSQEHYLMACLELLGLTDCDGVNKPIASRLTKQDQPEVPLLRSFTVA